MLAEFCSHEWCLKPDVLNVMLSELLREKMKGGLSPSPAAEPRGNTAKQSVAIINVRGMLLPRASWLMQIFGGTGMEDISTALHEAMADDDTVAVILRVDSPGGTAAGTLELASEIYGMRGIKPIVAQVEGMGASAAYWIASAADEIVITPSGQAGSVGVYQIHDDITSMMEKEGVKRTIIRAGKNKIKTSGYEPLRPC